MILHFEVVVFFIVELNTAVREPWRVLSSYTQIIWKWDCMEMELEFESSTMSGHMRPIDKINRKTNIWVSDGVILLILAKIQLQWPFIRFKIIHFVFLSPAFTVNFSTVKKDQVSSTFLNLEKPHKKSPHECGVKI